MTNPIGPRATSLLGNASSLLGSAKEAVKAMADAATAPTADKPDEKKAAPAKGRLGVELDRYA
ncbi:hypothetical protein [Actinoplanes derwentensis]|uniref:Uncharacterized protein n=1 Tax=Actinoplanes derwentensis TaxID=113562 RepID=A0A1H1Q7B5_9ACTN|nr:hypothetical protein [Actinoplanes derwentensis]GID82217.1 hypothetical protein Ade03nite_11410 [Actinoplanes derwentensis]SDS19264.1 hypothetical protein SAMN04489716_0224 [Actinoplanes derwentensis]